MGCKNCGDGNRHKIDDITLVQGQKKESKPPGEPLKYMSVSESGEPATPIKKAHLRTDEMPSPQEAFEAAKQLSYEEIVRMTESQQKMVDSSSMAAMSDMTVAMKRYHVTSLLAVANYDTTTMTGISPSQALVGVHKVLLLEEFKCVNDIYPDLLKKVSDKVDQLMQGRIIVD